MRHWDLDTASAWLGAATILRRASRRAVRTATSPPTCSTATRLMNSRWAANSDGQWAVFTLEGDYVVDYVNACIYRGDSSIQQLEVP